jgi:hypothetical protein
MFRFRVGSFFLSCVFLLFSHSLKAQDAPSAPHAYVPADVPNPVGGFRAQVEELIRVGKMHDQATWSIALDTFALPKGSAWFEANFAPRHVA